jgi:Probable zinc-ribbon domain
MKSGKQRRAEIHLRRLEKAKLNGGQGIARRGLWYGPKPAGGTEITSFVEADRNRLVHDTSHRGLPLYYIDYAFTCRDCGVDQLWTAKQQKWWYEIAKGKLGSTAIHCRPCRRVRQARRAQARKVHIEGMIAKFGIEAAARLLQRPVEEVAGLITGRRPR